MDEIGLTAEKGRGLQNVDDGCHWGDLVDFVDIGQYRHTDLPLHLGEYAQAFVHSQPAHRGPGAAVGLVVGSLEKWGMPRPAQISFMRPATSRQSCSDSAGTVRR